MKMWIVWLLEMLPRYLFHGTNPEAIELASVIVVAAVLAIVTVEVIVGT